jgi:hypothetical protein
MEHEKELLPLSQAEARVVMNAKAQIAAIKVERDELRRRRDEHSLTREFLSTGPRDYERRAAIHKKMEADSELTELRARDRGLEVELIRLERLRNNRGLAQNATDRRAEEDEASMNMYAKLPFIRRCTKEGCNGFNDLDYCCGVCSNYTCAQCGQSRDTVKKDAVGHECKKEDVDNLKYMKENCRPCPKCGYGIEKKDGCDQMWCKNCHSAFSWNTGRLESGRIHNPHYYEWLRSRSETGEIPREAGDGGPLDVCGPNGRINEVPYARIVEVFGGLGKERLRVLEEIHQQVSHLENDELVRSRNVLRQKERNLETIRRFCRVEYLCKEKNEEVIGEEIYKRKLDVMKEKCIPDIIETFVNMAKIEFHNLMKDGDRIHNMNTFIHNIHQCLELINDELFECQIRYNFKHNGIFIAITKSPASSTYINRFILDRQNLKRVKSLKELSINTPH